MLSTAASGLLTAAEVHHRWARAVQARRADVLTAAYRSRPERPARKPPVPSELPDTSGINLPEQKQAAGE